MNHPHTIHRGAVIALALVMLTAGALTSPGQCDHRAGAFLKQNDEWFRSEEGRRTTDNVLSWHSLPGSWPKNKSTTSVTGRPLFSGRDGVPKYQFNGIEAERRSGYAWYGTWGEQVAADYPKWSKKWLKPASDET